MPKVGSDFGVHVRRKHQHLTYGGGKEGLELRVLREEDYNSQGEKRSRQKQKRCIVEVEIGRKVDTGGVRERATLRNMCGFWAVGINV